MAAVPAVTGSERNGSRPSARVTPFAVGVVVWLASEVMFFAGLFAAYYTLRAANTLWPPPGVDLDVLRAFVFTIVLVVSSGTMHAAVKAAEGGDRRQSLRWLSATFVLGALFLLNLGLEWAANDFSLSSNAYGSIYYLLTGFHGLHVLGGLVLMVLAAVAVTGPSTKVPLGPTFSVSAYYWHFVDVVWLAVFATVFLVQ